MDGSIISALAGLTGAAIGGLAYALSIGLSARKRVRADWLAQDRIRRQDLYKAFIKSAARCYGAALQYEEPDISALVDLHIAVGEMRILSSPDIFKSAQEIVRKVLNTYAEPAKSFAELRAMANNEQLDLLSDFTEACRAEQESLNAQQF